MTPKGEAVGPMADPGRSTTTICTALFPNGRAADAAVHDLVRSGVPAGDISLIDSEHDGRGPAVVGADAVAAEADAHRGQLLASGPTSSPIPGRLPTNGSANRAAGALVMVGLHCGDPSGSDRVLTICAAAGALRTSAI